MAGSTKNFHLVPVVDRPYFLRATVVGLRAQLEGLGLDSSGLKVDLYLRLTNGGHSLYTDDRDQSDSDQSDSDQPDGDQSDGDHPGDDQPENNDGDDGQGSDDQGGDPPGGAGQKRRRDDGGGDDDGDDNDDDNQGSPPPPPRKTLRVGGAIPAELRLQIMGYLNFPQLWNLTMAAPAGYLTDDIDVFVMDARRQHAIDYPPVDSDDSGSGSGGSGSGSSSSSNGSDDYDYRDDPNRPLSTLQWVGRRLIYDPAFGTAWRARIFQLIDSYLQVYGQADNAYEDGNVIEDMLYYFRPQPLYGTRFPLVWAARNERPDIVHLLLLRGEPVDQATEVTGRAALNEAVGGIGVQLTATQSGSDRMHTIFALIGAGADVTLVSENTRDAARDMLEEIMDVPVPGAEDWHTWQRIVNVRGLSVREFIADPRSDYFDRIRLAMYVIVFQSEDYPGLE
ncbi:hypothetical protein INS49_014584 [Diaporthe citri]|uniref:uncharacterized protein n=1 Tax=Diaporthe citri TaxID=83186 RepID=UPI001C801D3E|nr:uncharacterized protein INS49_014584 [Diaporthe citri]KAG6356710.1 hypothetical protein INS49_014584 [Diaporthe citri]